MSTRTCRSGSSQLVKRVTYIPMCVQCQLSSVQNVCVCENKDQAIFLRFNARLLSQFQPASSTLPLLSKLSRTPTERFALMRGTGCASCPIKIKMCVHVQWWNVSNTKINPLSPT